VKDAKGRFVKGDPIALTVMEKRAGWGTEYPDDLRNGEWEYAAFSLDGKLNTRANYKACFQCHKPHEKLDFVISYSSIAGQVAAAAPAGRPAADVTKGQTHTQTFATAGVYEYICGLHPAMKGSVEVK
jgi:hypothetical protein